MLQLTLIIIIIIIIYIYLYSAELDSCKMLSDNDLLLLDSGAQYVDGTTDVTRTFHTGSPTEYQVVTYTRYFDIIRDIIGIDYT